MEYSSSWVTQEPPPQMFWKPDHTDAWKNQKPVSSDSAGLINTSLSGVQRRLCAAELIGSTGGNVHGRECANKLRKENRKAAETLSKRSAVFFVPSMGSHVYAEQIQGHQSAGFAFYANASSFFYILFWYSLLCLTCFKCQKLHFIRKQPTLLNLG